MSIKTIQLLAGTLTVLIIATIGVFILRRMKDRNLDPAVVETFRSRIQAWWLLFCPLVGAFFLGPLGPVFLFTLISLFAFREYITVVPTRLADHRSLFWVYIFCIPTQFTLVGLDPAWFRATFGITPYSVFSILIPAYVFLLVPAWIATSNDPKRFLERIAKIQVGLLICVYCLSFVPALLTMEMPEREGAGKPVAPLAGPELIDSAVETVTHAVATVVATGEHAMTVVATDEHAVSSDSGSGAPQTETISKNTRDRMRWEKLTLLFFFVLIVQIGDVLQYIGSQLTRPATTAVAPTINSTRTWYGVLGGAAATALTGIALWYFTPFPKWWQPGCVALAVSLMGFAGSMTMSAIKRDKGVEDYGTLVEGHGGILDRLDSLCFAAPMFYHLTWAFLRT